MSPAGGQNVDNGNVQVVDYTGCSVQYYSSRQTSGTTFDITLGTEVDPNRSLVIGGMWWDLATDVSLDNEFVYRIELIDGTTVRHTRAVATTNPAEVGGHVIEFNDGVRVQRGVGTLGTTTTVLNVTLGTAVDSAKSFCLFGASYGRGWCFGENTGTGDDYTGMMATSKLTTSTNLQIERSAHASTTSNYAWQVAEYVTSLSPVLSAPVRNHRTNPIYRL